jgi:anthranilate/para-aminobenzoate synthase component I
MGLVQLDSSDAAHNPNWILLPAEISESKTNSIPPPGSGTHWYGFISYDYPIAATFPACRFVSVSAPRQQPDPGDFRAMNVRANFSRDDYVQAVQRCKEYIAAGDIYQVNLSQRFTASFQGDPYALYLRLMKENGALYGAYLDFEDFVLISNSPELFFRVRPQPDGSRTIVTRPIKGTRRRAPGMDIELRDSVKDQAELNMIVDLERNDLGRICQVGSVKVTQPRVIEAHPTVYHGVATIEGILRPEVTFADILRAMFPGGSVTGAPKIRAMQIIEALEPVHRGPYCGAIGYLAPDGSMEFNIAIRTMIIKDGLVHIPVGGAVVADSTPAGEYDETLVKAKAMFDSLSIDRV